MKKENGQGLVEYALLLVLVLVVVIAIISIFSGKSSEKPEANCPYLIAIKNDVPVYEDRYDSISFMVDEGTVFENSGKLSSDAYYVNGFGSYVRAKDVECKTQ